jgi:hypothetical protein
MSSLVANIKDKKAFIEFKGDCIYVTRELRDMQECSAKDRHGLKGVKITDGKGHNIASLQDKESFAWATQGHVLALRPLGYEYAGDDFDITFSGPAPAKDEWFEISAEAGDHVCDLRNGKKLVVTLTKAEDWPDINSIVNEAIESSKSYTIGMDTRLLKMIQKGLSESSVVMRISDNPLDPIIVQPRGDEKSLIMDITTGGVNGEFSIAMPLRVD